jgi:hypothetical protein
MRHYFALQLFADAAPEAGVLHEATAARVCYESVKDGQRRRGRCREYHGVLPGYYRTLAEATETADLLNELEAQVDCLGAMVRAVAAWRRPVRPGAGTTGLTYQVHELRPNHSIRRG